MSKAWGRKAAEWLYHRLSGWQVLKIDETRSLLSGLYGGNLLQTEEMVAEHYIRLIRRIGCVMLTGVLITGVYAIYHQVYDGNRIHIVRGDYGNDPELITLYYEDSSHHKQPIELEIDPIRYREEELEEVFARGFAYLEELMPGENKDLATVTTDLCLKTSIPDSGLHVNWVSDDYEYLSDDGRVHNEELLSVVAVNLTLELSYEEEVRKREYTIRITPEDADVISGEQAQAVSMLEKELRKHEYEKEIELPALQEGYHYFVTDQEKQGYMLLVIITIFMVALIIVRSQSQLKEQIQSRKHQLELEYSYFMNQILLYISAGNTVQGAILRIISQYEKQDQREHPLYQELTRIKYEIHTGTSQEQAFIHFGRRTGVLAYMKAMALLTQHMKKGGQGMEEQLEQEEHEAFERRKELAKRTGEEAGTKLLLPMILLMIVSMVLVMYPAFASFTFEF